MGCCISHEPSKADSTKKALSGKDLENLREFEKQKTDREEAEAIVEMESTTKPKTEPSEDRTHPNSKIQKQLVQATESPPGQQEDDERQKNKKEKREQGTAAAAQKPY